MRTIGAEVTLCDAPRDEVGRTRCCRARKGCGTARGADVKEEESILLRFMDAYPSWRDLCGAYPPTTRHLPARGHSSLPPFISTRARSIPAASSALLALFPELCPCRNFLRGNSLFSCCARVGLGLASRMGRSRRRTACVAVAAALLVGSAHAADVPVGNKGKLLPSGEPSADLGGGDAFSAIEHRLLWLQRAQSVEDVGAHPLKRSPPPAPRRQAHVRGRHVDGALERGARPRGCSPARAHAGCHSPFASRHPVGTT